MANYDTWIIATLTDANGDSAQMRIPLGPVAEATTLTGFATTIAAYITALGAPGTITNAKVTSIVGSFLYEKANPTGAVNAVYSSVTDGARLNFLNSLGGKGVSTIPAPVPAVFGAAPNEDTVDAGGVVATYITWYEATAAAGGSHLNLYNGGVKVGRGARKRAQHKVG